MPVNRAAFSPYEAKLAGLQRKSRLRALAPQQGIDFTSNDYLGLADSPRLKAAFADAIGRGVPVGAGGSRLLRGNHREHEALEAEAAALFGAEKAIYFGSGFAANVALFSTLPLREDLVLYDALIHASVHDGIAAGKAKAIAVPHNQVEAFEREIIRWRQEGGRGRPWIAVESLYSMDGDRAPFRPWLILPGNTEASLSSMKPMPPVFSAPVGAVLPRSWKAGAMWWHCTPAARRSVFQARF